MHSPIHGPLSTGFSLMGIAALFLASSCAERTTPPVASFLETIETVATVPGGGEPVNVNFLPPYKRVDSVLVKTETGAQFVISNEKSSPLYDEIVWGPYGDPSKTFSKAFKRWGPFTGPDTPVYMARTGKKTFAVVGGVPEKSFDAINPYTAVPLNDGNLAYVGVRGKKKYVSLRGKEYGPYDDIDQTDDLIVSPDGKRVAFVARRGTRHAIVIDGQESTWYGMVSTPLFTPDGGHVAFLASRTETHSRVLLFKSTEILVVDNKETARRETESDGGWLSQPLICESDAREYLFAPMTDCASISRAKFSPFTHTEYYVPTGSSTVLEARSHDGSVVATVTGSGEIVTKTASGSSTTFKKWQAIINGTPGPQYDYVWMPVPSDDENTVIYGAYDAAKKAYLRVLVRVR